MAKDEGTGKKFAIVALLSAAVGLVTGLLTAPKSGKETREDIKNAASKAAREAEKKLKEVHAELSDLIHKGNDELKKRGAEAKAGLDSAVTAAKEAQAKVKEVISTLRNGEATDPELEKALKDAANAKAHLAKYFKS